jgi:hypothetical protein
MSIKVVKFVSQYICVLFAAFGPGVQPSLGDTKEQPVPVTVCQVDSVDVPYASRLVSMKGTPVVTGGSYNVYLDDSECPDGIVWIQSPTNYSKESGVGDFIDMIRTDRSPPRGMNTLICSLTGRIRYHHKPWAAFMQLEKAQCIWTSRKS